MPRSFPLITNARLASAFVNAFCEMDEKETIQTDSGVIYAVPVWEWVLG
ncbi:MAG: hypothetical protein IJA95_05165 [Bacteroidaceae bacterium]|nr:hypothetical protein [Bacteroidaceae bacterium]